MYLSSCLQFFGCDSRSCIVGSYGDFRCLLSLGTTLLYSIKVHILPPDTVFHVILLADLQRTFLHCLNLFVLQQTLILSFFAGISLLLFFWRSIVTPDGKVCGFQGFLLSPTLPEQDHVNLNCYLDQIIPILQIKKLIRWEGENELV